MTMVEKNRDINQKSFIVNWVWKTLNRPPFPTTPELAKTGVNPKQPGAFIDGEYRPIAWKKYQNWETWDENSQQKLIFQWHSDSRLTGLSTLGGWNGKHWLCWVDFDLKHFLSKEDLQNTIESYKERYSLIKEAPQFTTPSGGYRILIALSGEPQNFNASSGFSLHKGSSNRMGEVLTKNGAHTLLPPSKGYQWTYFPESGYPPVVENLASVGIYPVGRSNKNSLNQNSQPLRKDMAATNEVSSHDQRNDINRQQNKAREYLKYLTPEYADEYETWLKVGQALHSVCSSDELLDDWIEWSKSSPKFKEGECEQKWKSFGGDRGITLGTLYHYAYECGYNISSAQFKDSSVEYLVENETVESVVLRFMFEDGKGDWAVFDDSFHRFTGFGHWQRVPDGKVFSQIAEMLRRCYCLKAKKGETPQKKYDYYNDAKITSTFKACRKYLTKERPDNSHLVAFLDCTVDLRTGEKMPHKREHYLTFSIPSNYKPSSECPSVYRESLVETFGEEFIPLVRAIISMLLDPTAPHGKFPYLVGPSGSGKGTHLRFWASLLGPTAVRSITSFEDLSSAEKRHQHLTGTQFVVFPDMGGYARGLRALYELVDNGSLSGRALFSSYGYEKKWNCRFAIASVGYLQIENSGDGWKRRCIPLPTKIRSRQEDPNLGKKLESVKGEVISWALAMPREERDRLLMAPSSWAEGARSAQLEQDIFSDSVRAFVDSCLRPNDNDSTMENFQVYDLYRAFCKAYGFLSLSMTKFISHLKNVIPHNRVNRQRKRVEGKVTNISPHWRNLFVLPKAFNQGDGNFNDRSEYVCIKSGCSEGGLMEFQDFQLPIPADPRRILDDPGISKIPKPQLQQGFQLPIPADPMCHDKSLATEENFSSTPSIEKKVEDGNEKKSQTKTLTSSSRIAPDRSDRMQLPQGIEPDPRKEQNGHLHTGSPSDRPGSGSERKEIDVANQTEIIPSPIDAVTISDGRVTVFEDKLDLFRPKQLNLEPWKPRLEPTPYSAASKCYLDIETVGGLDPELGKIISIGLLIERDGQTTTEIFTDRDERQLLKTAIAFLQRQKPQLLIGHNLFNFDIPYIVAKSKHHGIPTPFWKANRPTKVTASSFHGKPLEITQWFWDGVDILDTFVQACIYDKSASVLPNYRLKDVAIHLGVRDKKRLELDHNEINQCWEAGNLERIEEYLRYDLIDTKGLADFFLPVVWYQKIIVPRLSLQRISVGSPALKWEKIAESFYPNEERPNADEKLKYEGAITSCNPGLYRDAYKLDVSSMYPSIIVRYELASSKDKNNNLLRVMAYLMEERLRLKRQYKETGNSAYNQQQNALKILINGGYGFFGTGGYSFNDMKIAALVTAYGRKILKLMVTKLEELGVTVIETDTDGIICTGGNPEDVLKAVQNNLPDGITIGLDWANTHVYVAKSKSYLLFDSSGSLKRVGNFRKRDKSKLELDFPVEFLKAYLNNPDSAESYYHSLRQEISYGTMPVERLQVTKKISKSDRQLTEAGLGQKGDKVTFYYGEEKRFDKRTDKELKSIRKPVIEGDYYVGYYLECIDKLYSSITTVL